MPTITRSLRVAPWVLLATGIFLAFVVPFVMLVVMAFRTDIPGLPGQWSTTAFVETLTDGSMVGPALSSLVFAGASAIVSTALALWFVFLATRTATRLRRVITPVMVVILATPVLFFALSWGMLGADRVGLLNSTWTRLTGSTQTVFDITSWPGLILVMALKLSAFSYFLLLGPSSAMNRSLEEAAEVSGSRRSGVVWRIYLPLMSPAIAGSLLVGFIAGLQAFDTPQIIGTQAGIHVLSTEILRMVTTYPASYAGAATVALALAAVLALLVVLQFRLLAGRSYTTVGGRRSAQHAWTFPRTGWLLDASIVVFTFVALVLPTAQLVLSSFSSVMGRYDRFTLRNYQKFLADPSTPGALRNTVAFMVVGGLVAVAAGALLTVALRLRPTRWKRALELPTWIPWAMPGLVGSLAILGTILVIPALHPFYGTSAVMFVALVIGALPVSMRFTESSVLQIDRELVDASKASGAGPWTSFRTVILPLIAPAFVAGWFVTGVGIAGNLEVPLLLGSTKTTTLAGLAYEYYTDSAAPVAAAVFCVLLLSVVALGLLALLARWSLRGVSRTVSRARWRSVAPVPAT